MEVLMSYLGSVAFIVLLALSQVLMVAVGVVLISLIKKGIKKANLEIDEKTMECIEDTICTIVAATNQKMVNDLKDLSPDGKLTEEQKETIFEHVKTLVLASLSTHEMDYIINKYTDLDKGIEVLIESAVNYNHVSSIVGGVEELPDSCIDADMSAE